MTIDEMKAGLLIIVQLPGTEIIGQLVRYSETAIHLKDCLRLVLKSHDGGNIQMGLEPMSLTIAKEKGDTGHKCEISRSMTITGGPPVPEVEDMYRRATGRIQLAASAFPPPPRSQ